MLDLSTFNVACDALLESRPADALKVLTSAGMSLDRALVAIGPGPTVGDILVCSWGYDQTNIDYYQVIKVTKASVRIGKIRSTLTRGQYEDAAMPVRDAFVADHPTQPRYNGKMFRVRLGAPGEGYSVKIESYASAYLWDGKPRNQTASGYGH
jgi:hypothetical protein